MRTSSTVDGWVVRATSGPVPARLGGVEVPATVPGVHTDLLAAGLIPDPYLDENERQLEWMRATWRYTTTVPGRPPRPRASASTWSSPGWTRWPRSTSNGDGPWPDERTCTAATASTCDVAARGGQRR